MQKETSHKDNNEYGIWSKLLRDNIVIQIFKNSRCVPFIELPEPERKNIEALAAQTYLEIQRTNETLKNKQNGTN